MAQYQTLQTRACSHKHHIADMILVTDQFLYQISYSNQETARYGPKSRVSRAELYKAGLR